MVALVLLPGLDGIGRLFEDFVVSLGSEYDVIVVSYPEDKPHDYAALETLVRSRLPVDKPFFLLAESFSGPIAISIASSSPAGLLGLILCCTFAQNPLPILAPVRRLARVLPVSLLPHLVVNFLLLGRFANKRLKLAIANTLESVSPEVLRVRALAALSVDVTEKLKCNERPILYMLAKEDRVVSRRSLELIVSLQPDTQVVEFQAPHFLLQVFPVEAAQTVKRFIDKVNKKAP